MIITQKTKKTGSKTYYYRKSFNHKGGEQENKKGTINYKIAGKMNAVGNKYIYVYIIN